LLSSLFTRQAQCSFGRAFLFEFQMICGAREVSRSFTVVPKELAVGNNANSRTNKQK
jgi:hypothetical protein